MAEKIEKENSNSIWAMYVNCQCRFAVVRRCAIDKKTQKILFHISSDRKIPNVISFFNKSAEELIAFVGDSFERLFAWEIMRNPRWV